LFCLSFALAAVLAVATPDTEHRSVDLRYDVYVGDETHPVNTGVVWLLRYSWYGPVRAQIGAILEGRATIAFDSSVMPRLTHYDALHDDHYVIAFELPDTQWYISRPVNGKRFFSDLPGAIETIGTVAKGARGAPPALGLARSDVRTITLLNEDGTPAKEISLSVSAHVSDSDHCGTEQGPQLGEFESNRAGVFSLRAPAEPLFLGAEYYVSVGGRFALQSGIVVGTGRAITLRRKWNLPTEVVALRVVDPLGRPEKGGIVVSTLRSEMCGNPVGPVETTNARGVARIALKPLAINQMWVDLPGARRRTLTQVELTSLFVHRSLTIHV
jgi:hypothetical protein